MFRRVGMLLTIFLAAGLGNWNDTPTGIDLDKLPHFGLTRLTSSKLREDATITFDCITVAAGNSLRSSDAYPRNRDSFTKVFENSTLAFCVQSAESRPQHPDRTQSAKSSSRCRS